MTIITDWLLDLSSDWLKPWRQFETHSSRKIQSRFLIRQWKPCLHAKLILN